MKEKKLSISFFEKIRQTKTKNIDKEIEEIKWPKEVIDGKKQIIVTLPKEKWEVI